MQSGSGSESATGWKNRFDWKRVLPERLRPQSAKILRVFVIAFLLRVILMPLFAGTDAMTTAWVSTVLLGKGQLILSNDPPPVFYLHAAVFGIFRPIFPPNIYSRFISSIAFTPATFLQNSVLAEPGIAIVLVLLKLPYLVFDLATAILLLWVVEDPKMAQQVMKWWLFNPIVLFVSYFFGQFDVIAVFFVLLAFYYQRNGRRAAALTALSIGIFLKVFAIVLVPFFLLLYWEETKNWAARLKAFAHVAAAAIVPFALEFLIMLAQPVYYESANYALVGDQMNGFFGTTLYNRGAPSNPFVEGLLTFVSYSARLPTFAPIPDVIYLLPLAYVVLLIGWHYVQPKGADALWSATTVLFLLIYSLSLFHPQWFLWAQPFLIVAALRNGQGARRFYAGIIGLFFIYIWYWDGALTSLLVAPTIPGAVGWPGPITLLNSAGLPGSLIVNLARTGFSALCLCLAYIIVRKDLMPRGLRSQ